jgi:hypothetical protein
MTRKEQIRQASIEYTIKDRPMCIGGDAFSEIMDEMNRNHAFEEGAKWADSHPNLSEEEQVGMGEFGMMWQKKHLIEKACEWLSLNMTDIAYFGMNGDLYKPEFIQNFKQAMEG